MCQNVAHFFTRKVLMSDPNHLWWLTVEQTQIIKVRIKCHDRESILLSIQPNFSVRRIFKTKPSDLLGAVEYWFNIFNDSKGNVLIEKPFHDATRSLCSRSAANARHALMLSSVSSGKSVIIWFSVIPLAKFKTS